MDFGAQQFPGNNNRAHPPNNEHMIHARDRVFHALFHHIAMMYVNVVPRCMRQCLEIFLLLKAVALFGILVYLHVALTHNPAKCLSHVVDSWPRHGILRVEIICNISVKNHILDTYKKEYSDVTSFVDDNVMTYSSNDGEKASYDLENFGRGSHVDLNQDKGNRIAKKSSLASSNEQSYGNLSIIHSSSEENDVIDIDNIQREYFWEVDKLVKAVWPEEKYIVEYALEHGLLRLSPEMRQRLNITVMLVTLDPLSDTCFGNTFIQFLLDQFLGYDYILMSSIKELIEQEENKGFLRNVITGEHYRIVSVGLTKASYTFAAFIMLVFTISVSTLLHYSQQQIFLFIVDLLHILEMNATAAFPAACLLTVVLALVGMEAIMSEFFNDTTTAFYIIMIIWVADQYDVVCCHTSISKRHWLRYFDTQRHLSVHVSMPTDLCFKFFYLYHYAFYAYHYRFSGTFNGLALFVSWSFIEHSMIYFLHHYELPAILTQQQGALRLFVALPHPQPPPDDSEVSSGGLRDARSSTSPGVEQRGVVGQETSSSAGGVLLSGVTATPVREGNRNHSTVRSRFRPLQDNLMHLVEYARRRQFRLFRFVHTGEQLLGGVDQEMVENDFSGTRNVTRLVQDEQLSNTEAHRQRETLSGGPAGDSAVDPRHGFSALDTNRVSDPVMFFYHLLMPGRQSRADPLVETRFSRQSMQHTETADSSSNDLSQVDSFDDDHNRGGSR